MLIDGFEKFERQEKLSEDESETLKVAFIKNRLLYKFEIIFKTIKKNVGGLYYVAWPTQLGFKNLFDILKANQKI